MKIPTFTTIQTKELFCHTYWKNTLKEINKRPRADRFDFSDANDALMLLDKNSNLAALIKNNDIVQRILSMPCKEDMILWRGIANPTDTSDKNFNYLKQLFFKCINLKKGDILYMPEYSFWSDSKTIALQCAKSTSANCTPGIIYELNLPKGVEVYNKIFPIFRRCTKFLCKENNKIIEGNAIYNHIKLTLLTRDI